MDEFDPFGGMTDDELDAMVSDLGSEPDGFAGEDGFRSGFVALVGRPNAGKSTLMNACMGTKMAITSPVAQTTRRGVVRREGVQIVFVDTPGLHKPHDSLGSELNKSALAELGDVDVLCFLIDASQPIGRGDAWVAERVAKSPAKRILVLTKADLASPERVLEQISAARRDRAFRYRAVQRRLLHRLGRELSSRGSQMVPRYHVYRCFGRYDRR